MASGDVLLVNRASVAIDVTNLQSHPSSAAWTTVWSGPTIDNSTTLDLDHLIAAQFVVAAAGIAAGEIRVSILTMLNDTTWPDVFSTGVEGTQSASAVIPDTEIRDCAFTQLWSAVTDATASRVYPMPQRSLVTALGFMPRKYALFVAHSTGANLAASGNGLWVQGQSSNIAP